MRVCFHFRKRHTSL